MTPSAELASPFAIAFLLFLGSALAIVGVLARSAPRAFRPWSLAWAALFLGGALLLLSSGELLPVTAALLGLPPPLLLVGSLGFLGRAAPSWVIALVPVGALLHLGLTLLGAATAPVWAAFVLANEGGAALLLYRGSRPGWSQARLLPFAMGFFAVAHSAGGLLYAETGLTQPLPVLALPVSVLAVVQYLAIQQRTRSRSERSQREHRESERRFQALAELSNLVVLILDPENRVVEWNEAAASIYGWSREEALGRNYLETFLAEDVRAPIQAEISRVLAGGQTHGYENPVRTRQGERVLRWNVSRLLDDDGEPSGILCLAEDISEERRRQHEQRRLAAAVEQAGEAITVVDRGGLVLYANPAFHRMLERPLSEVVDRPVQELFLGLTDQQIVQEITAAWTRGEIWKGRYTTQWSDGRRFMLDATVAPVRDERGEIAYGVAVVRDVTRELELERKVAHSQRLTALGTLASGVAHDFNNLLTAIMGGAHLLSEQTSGEARRTAADILEAAERGAALSRQLLAFSRRQPLHTEAIDLEAAVAETRGLLERLIGEHIELSTESDEGLWRVSAEKSQVEQVIMNLALNARDAMPGGGRISLRTSNRHFSADDPARPPQLEPGDYVSLCVGDSGMGMDEETRSRAFEPFFSRKEPGQGTGLGLSTVFGVARQMGGDVEIESAPGQGCRVQVYLPRSRDADREEDATLPSAGAAGRETILLVEDEPSVRRVARRALEERGYSVLEAEDGDRARALLRETQAVDLLLTDLIMPGTSGFELAQELGRSHPATRVLFISGYADASPAATRPAPLLEKPFTPDQLTRKVHDVLHGG